MDFRKTFDLIPEAFDKYRPRYCSELFEELTAVCGLDAQKKVLEAIRLLCALPGAPTIYYGDEIGMQGMADPWNRAPMDWDHADEAVRGAVKQLLNHRLNTPILQTGHLTLVADGPDALIIKRYAVDGKDVFGQPVEGDEVFVRIAR